MPDSSDRQAVEVDGRRLALSHLDRVLFPGSGHTKAQALHYYATVAPVLVPHTTDRPASFVRAPDGPEGQIWYAKNPPPGTPGWVTTVSVEGSGGPADHIVIDSTASLVAMANLGAYEVHVPQWTATGGPERHDRLVLDLDPGPGVDLVVCCKIALRLRQMLGDDGLVPACPVVSGSKGLHLYVPVQPASGRDAGAYARKLAGRMREEHPQLVVSTMARSARAGRVLIDWSQNASAKTTAAPYTLRIGDRARVTCPVDWEEVAACRTPADLAFGPEAVLRRVAERGDLLAPLAAPRRRGRLP